MNNISINLDDSILVRLDTFAAATGKTRDEIAAEAINRMFLDHFGLSAEYDGYPDEPTPPATPE